MTILTADFYPTPEAVATTMLDPLDLRGRSRHQQPPNGGPRAAEP